jgi:photosystem II stability/assembly factor-like uncharacterized protein/uncharacterized coiled-coil protein SlyX
MKHNIKPILFLFLFSFLFVLHGQKKQEEPETILSKTSINALKFRSIGPAITSGRISDFAVNPDNPKEYYVATSSGGVWKTDNGGTTYSPIFDSQGSYSIGVITMDPNNSNVIWVGTGENNNQRSVAYGDGVYKSEDGGKSWKNVGLKSSEHIGSIIIDPRNSDVVYVAAIGPLWSAGGERGLYKTTDGGKTWNAVLTVDEHTGVNEVIMDLQNPDILYASTHQRRRHVFTYIGGGPGSDIYKSTDAGATWEKANKGLPSEDKGKIGFAISPANPDIIYAIVEAAQGKGGFYKSTDKAARWEKQSSYSTSGNYYQEIVADPVNADIIYAMDTWMHVSRDGGKSFKVLGEVTKHVDNHCMWIDPTDNEHFLVGCDGGIYESFDGAKTWHYKPNLPITQFYKVAVDNAEPFYNVYGGTQDNFSMGGPARTNNGNGIQNEAWFMTHGGDGFESQIDPNDPNIVYAQSQYGVLVRYDRKNGEEVGIQPKPRKDENMYRWNWDAPLAVSMHKPGRLYFAANKLFRSDDRGDSWEVISEDLTRQINRNEIPVMGRIWGIDALMKNQSTSQYGTIVAFSESPLNENLLYVGTDDGLIQITEDGGTSWRKVEAFPGVPSRTYVNAVFASNHDENVVYAAFNNHKNGDFKPYLLMSTDKGKSWKSVSSNLPERGSVYSVVEDHESSSLLFAGTEFGVFFSIDKGKEWKQFGGLPTIAIRDIDIQKRENDLVLASFGRGFYVLDDYSSLRTLGSTINSEAGLFPVRDALAFEYRYPLGLPGKSFQGDSYYMGENLGSVAMFTYYLKDDIKSLEDQRKDREKEAKKEGKDNRYPNYEQLKKEEFEEKPQLIFEIKDKNVRVIRNLITSPSKGLNRVQWDLRYASKNPINLSSPSFYNPFAGTDQGTLVAPGTYSVTMSKLVGGEIAQLAGPVAFEVRHMDQATIPTPNRDEKVAFQRKVNELNRSVSGAQRTIGEIRNQLRHISEAAKKVELPYSEIYDDIASLNMKLADINMKLNNDPIASRLDIDKPPTVGYWVGYLMWEQSSSTAPPTKTHMRVYDLAVEEYRGLLDELVSLVNEDLAALQKKLEDAGAPYTPYTLPTLKLE